MWNGSDALAANAAARTYDKNIEDKIIKEQGILADLQTALKNAQKNLTDYQNNSPTVKAQIINEASAIANEYGVKKLVIGLIVLVVIIFGIVYFIKKFAK